MIHQLKLIILAIVYKKKKKKKKNCVYKLFVINMIKKERHKGPKIERDPNGKNGSVSKLANGLIDIWQAL